MKRLLATLLVGCAPPPCVVYTSAPSIPLRPAETWLCSTSDLQVRVVSDAEPVSVQVNGQRATCFLVVLP